MSLAQALAGRLGPAVTYGESQGAGFEDLMPEERGAVAGAIDKRIADFANGRVAARRALAPLGHGTAVIVQGPRRAPIWPEGTLGSITHTAGICCAVAAKRGRVAALGIDAEQAKVLEPAVIAAVTSEAERRMLAELPDTFATLVFSIKETAYKALAPYLEEVWGFDAVGVTVAPDAMTFEARLNRAAGPFAVGAVLNGVFAINDHHIVSGVAEPKPL